MDLVTPYTPRVSVIIPVYNGQAYIGRAIASVLTQTLDALELIVVDDCSTDSTPEILRGIADPRVRVLRNEENIGVVGSRNRAFAAVSGEFTAMLDHDDLALPTRLEKQAAYLSSHPDTVLIGTAAHITEAGRMSRPKFEGPTSAALIGWLLLVANPLVCSSVMFRTEVAGRLASFMQTEFAYAEDFEFYQRMAQFGSIARVDEPLTIYRLHGANTSRKYKDRMTDAAARALIPAYRHWLPGEDAANAAALITRHIASYEPVCDILMLRQVRHLLFALTEAYIAATVMEDADAASIRGQAERFWRRLIAISSSLPGNTAADFASLFGGMPETPRQRLHRALNRLPIGGLARAARRILARAPATPRVVPSGIAGELCLPAPGSPEDPPALFVVVEIAGPAALPGADCAAVDTVRQGQAVIDRYGLRPIYLLDEAAARHSDIVALIAGILARRGCAIGAWLHTGHAAPQSASHPTQAGEPGKSQQPDNALRLDALTQAVQSAFGMQPLFFSASHGGAAPGMVRLAHARGYRVDFSAGADARPFEARAYSVPGLAPFLIIVRAGVSGGAAIPVRHQTKVIASLMRGGVRDFLISYRCGCEPSMDVADLDAFCRYALHEAGFMPGLPSDLLARAGVAPCALASGFSNADK